MFGLVRLMLAFGSIAGQSPDVACANEPDRAACVETACRVASGLDFDVSECDGLAAHVRHNPPAYWGLGRDGTNCDAVLADDDYHPGPYPECDATIGVP